MHLLEYLTDYSVEVVSTFLHSEICNIFLSKALTFLNLAIRPSTSQHNRSRYCLTIRVPRTQCIIILIITLLSYLQEDYTLLYQSLEAMLSSKGHEEPDLYFMANGHVSTMTDSAEGPTSSMQHMQMDYSPKPMIREYATVEVNSMSEYSIPMRVDHSMEPCSSRSSESCLSTHAANEHEKNIVMTNRNVSYHNHPGSVSVIVDANGYVTNGNMRVPPEGMETTCKMLPQ